MDVDLTVPCYGDDIGMQGWRCTVLYVFHSSLLCSQLQTYALFASVASVFNLYIIL